MTQRPAGLPSPEQVIELLNGEFARAGYEIEAVSIDDRTRPPLIRVVADGDAPLDLEAVAELSRSASALLDDLDTGATPYTLEVSSPGVDRPLTEEKHFRRARGRMVEVLSKDGAAVVGRLGATTDGVIDLVIRAGATLTVRQLPITDINTAVVQVEFSRPSAKELEMAGGGQRIAGTEAEA